MWWIPGGGGVKISVNLEYMQVIRFLISALGIVTLDELDELDKVRRGPIERAGNFIVRIL